MSAITGSAVLWVRHAPLTLIRLRAQSMVLDAASVCLCGVDACGMASETHVGNGLVKE